METFPDRARLCGLSVVLGAVSALVGIGLLKLIHGFTNLFFHGSLSFAEHPASSNGLGWKVIFIPAAGGLIIGIIARFVCPGIRGHGIPEAMQGVMANQSRIPLKTALLKPLCTALSIGTGGPFGAEGPVIATGGAVGSLLGQWIPHSASERKILLAGGAAAGMTAVFGTPLAGVLLAVELLLFEFSPRSLLPVAMAAGASMAVRGWIGEPFPMLPFPMPEAPGLLLTTGAVAVGITSGLASVGITGALHFIEDFFEKLPFDPMWWPALGGLAVGVIGWIQPRTLGPGYENLHDLLGGRMGVSVLLVLGLLKFLSWSISLGSGTAGGTLAPVMTLGGTVGALTALLLDKIPGLAGFPAGFAALVGMAAIFAGASRALLASVAFAFEATHAGGAFGPLLLGCATAILISRLLMKESIMTGGLSRKGIKVPENYEPDILGVVPVGEVMTDVPVTIPPEMTVGFLAEQISSSSVPWSLIRLFPIIDQERTLLGVISRADVLAAVLRNPSQDVLAIATTHPFTIRPWNSLAEAADLMVRHGIGRLPVVDDHDPPRLAGLLSRREVLSSRKLKLAQEARPDARLTVFP